MITGEKDRDEFNISTGSFGKNIPMVLKKRRGVKNKNQKIVGKTE